MGQIILKYYNPHLNIAMDNWRQVYLLGDTPVKLIPEYYKGTLVYRVPQQSKRYSYKMLKAGLINKTVTIMLEDYICPF